MDLPLDNFKQHVVNWLPGNIPTQLSICLFKSAINSLLSNVFVSKAENFSFSDSTSPFLLVLPTKEQDKTIIAKLHHRKWWRDTWNKCCDLNEGSIEILVTVILYMDGISLDVYGRLSLTPLNMTL